MRKSFVILLLIGLIKTLNAQFSPEYYLFKEKYPNANSVVTNDEATYTISLIKDEIDIKVNSKKEILYISPTAKYSAEESVQHSTFFELISIDAATLIYENKKYKKIPIKEFKVSDELSGNIFHDDTKTTKFVYPYLDEGVMTNLITEEKINNPRFLMAHFFGDYSPVVKGKFTIIVDKSIQLKFKTFNYNNTPIKYTTSESKGMITHSWEVNDLEKFESEENSTDIRYRLPHIVPYISEYKTKNGSVKNLLTDDVKGLYSWYYSLVKDLDDGSKNLELKATVDSLIKDKNTELEKVKAIYYWTQKNIKYVAFEYALGGFVPREASDVFEKKYGDCKDNSNILFEMLKIAGIQGYLTWVGTRSIPYKYAEVPTPLSDNHMILTYINNADTLFLDATGRYHALGTPSSFIQGKEVLIGIDENNYKITTVPVMNPEFTSAIDSVNLTINKNGLKGNGSILLTGYNKIDAYNYLEQVKTEDQRLAFYNASLEKGSNKFLISTYKENNSFDYDKPFVIDYNFTIDDYISSTNDELFINMNLAKRILLYKLEDKRKNDFETDFKNTNKLIATLEIPTDYKLSYIPSDLSINNEFYSIEIKYTVKENKLIYYQYIKLNFLILKKSEHALFNEFLKQISKSYKDAVVLKKITQ